MKNPDEQQIKEFFEEELRKSGHTFESKVEKILQKDFTVRREMPYFDKDGKTVRSIDFEAKIYFPGYFEPKPSKEPALGVLNLIVECKDSKNYGWIFYNDPTAHNTMHNFDVVNWKSHTKKKPGVDFPTLSIIPIRDILYASKCVEYFFPNKKEEKSHKKQKDVKPFMDSIYSVTKATDHFLENEIQVYDVFVNKKIKLFPFNQTFTVFQPLIVFGGHLYEAVSEGSETKLNPIKMVQMRKTYFSENYKIDRGVIHIVTLEGLSEYLEKLKEDFLITSDFLKSREKPVNIF